MEAIVLAGGFGTRLSHVVSDVPKPMAPINGKPFLEYVFDNLAMNGITRSVIAVGYKKESIIDYFGTSYRGIDFTYSIEDEPLGTGGAIKKALKLCKDENVYIVNGDTYIDADLTAMNKFHRDYCADLTIAVKLMIDFDRYGTVETEKERIVSFQEKKPTKSGRINAGIYLIRRSLLDDTFMDIFSFEKDVMEKHTADKRIFAYPANGYFIDIGVPEDYYKAQVDFSNGR